MTNLISHILRGSKEAEIIEILVENYDKWLDAEDISQMTDLDLSFVNDYLSFLIDNDVVLFAYNDKTSIYMLNRKNPFAMGFILLEHIVVVRNLDKMIKEK